MATIIITTFRIRADPAVVIIIGTVRRSIDPIAVAVIITARIVAADSSRMPTALFIVIAIGMSAIRIGLGNLVADHGTAYAAEHSAERLVTASGNDITKNRADCAARNRANNAI